MQALASIPSMNGAYLKLIISKARSNSRFCYLIRKDPHDFLLKSKTCRSMMRPLSPKEQSRASYKYNGLSRFGSNRLYRSTRLTIFLSKAKSGLPIIT